MFLIVHFLKAFDSVSFDFIQYCLKILGFGTHFCKWVSILLREISAVTVVNGNISDKFSVGRAQCEALGVFSDHAIPC